MAKYWAQCIDCGQWVHRNWNGKRPKVCAPDGIARLQRAALDMHLKRGETWQRWQASAGPAGRPRVVMADVLVMPLRPAAAATADDRNPASAA